MNPLQKAAVRRKMYYFGAIVVLFTVSMFWRGIIEIPLSGTARASEGPTGIHRAANSLNSSSILNQALALDLRELEQGEPEIEAEGLRLALIGSRGFAVTYLWQAAIENQKRNDFHKMEIRIRQVTQLQPHFITPWIFQSWNVAYNVSVEMQGSGDMYHYIVRGIELLAEGERRNSHVFQDRKIGSPDMRYWIAFYYQNKFGVSDQVEVLRCLFQLSCISPDDRNPDELVDPRTGAVNPLKFREFCEKNPHLVRRLRGEDLDVVTHGDEQASRRAREGLKCPKPEQIIQFLRDNREIPTRFKSAKQLADPDKQFPVLPPKFPEGQDEAEPGMDTKDYFTAYKAARAWYSYALVPVPPNPLDAEGEPLPSPTPRPGEYDPLLYRVPRSPMLILFRQGAPRVQSLQAEMEQKEGWFDDEGWLVDNPRDVPGKWWFPDPAALPGSPRPLNVVVGKEQPTSLAEWRLAAEMWSKHGYQYGLEVPPGRLQRYEKDAREGMAGLSSDPTPTQLADPAFKRRYQANMAVFFYPQNRSVTNFPFFLASAEAEARAGTVRARKILWKAEQARKIGEKGLATRLYQEGLELWKAVLTQDRNFHRPERSDHTEEETYAYELSYLRLLVQDDERIRVKANELVAPCLAVIPFLALPYPVARYEVQRAENDRIQRLQTVVPFLQLPFPNLEKPPDANPQWSREALEEIKWFVVETPEFSPFAGLMKVNDERNGGPWIRSQTKDSVRAQQGIQRRGAVQQPPSGPPTGPPGVPPGVSPRP